VDEEVDVVQPVFQDRGADGERQAGEGGDNEVTHRLAKRREEHRWAERRVRGVVHPSAKHNHRAGVGQPLELLTLVPARPAQADHEGRGGREREHLHETPGANRDQPQRLAGGPAHAERVGDGRQDDHGAELERTRLEGQRGRENNQLGHEKPGHRAPAP